MQLIFILAVSVHQTNQSVPGRMMCLVARGVVFMLNTEHSVAEVN